MLQYYSILWNVKIFGSSWSGEASDECQRFLKECGSICWIWMKGFSNLQNSWRLEHTQTLEKLAKKITIQGKIFMNVNCSRYCWFQAPLPCLPWARVDLSQNPKSRNKMMAKPSWKLPAHQFSRFWHDFKHLIAKPSSLSHPPRLMGAMIPCLWTSFLP